MSWEGYEIHLCRNGHKFQAASSYDFATCPTCGAETAWVAVVDQTNDSGVEPLLVLERASVLEECPCCHHVKVLEAERYQIPKRGAPLQYIDLDHPEDGPFSSNKEAYENKYKKQTNADKQQ